MGFLNDVSIGGKKISSTDSGSSFLDSVSVPENQERANQLVEMRNQAKELEAQSKKMNSFGGVILGTAKEIGSIPVKAVKNTWDIYNETPHKIYDDILYSSEDLRKGGIINISKGVFKGGFRVAADVAIAIFAPIGAAIGSILENNGGQKLIDNTGQVIADKSGITDLPAFQKFAMQHPNFAEDFNRLLMLALATGEKGKIEPRKLLGEVDKVSKSLVEQARPVPQTEPAKPVIKTPAEKQAEYAKSQGYEPYTPVDQLPVIDAGKPAKESLPSIQIGESIKVTKNTKGDWVYEPIKEDIITSKKETGVIKTQEPEFVSQRPGGFIETAVPPEGKSFKFKQTPPPTEIKISKLSRDIEAKINEDFGDLPEYKVMNMADQAQKAIKFIADDPVKAKNVAMGNESSPSGIKEGSIFVALREQAYKNNDVQTLMELAKSKLASEVTVLGQRIKAYDASKIMNDPVKIIKTIEDLNKTRFEKAAGKKVSKVREENIREIKESIKKTSSNKQSWSEFIESIKCK